jgi:hypothetical protein
MRGLEGERVRGERVLRTAGMKAPVGTNSLFKDGMKSSAITMPPVDAYPPEGGGMTAEKQVGDGLPSNDFFFYKLQAISYKLAA